MHIKIAKVMTVDASGIKDNGETNCDNLIVDNCAHKSLCQQHTYQRFHKGACVGQDRNPDLLYQHLLEL